jgi:23S rRNA G2069 N7-methylase RlmK/C1962 C5-methylase RlmI
VNFFDQYDEFYATSRVGSHPNRMNRLYKAIIEANIDVIRGRTVLDIASHNGRWTFAALMAGARHVIGVEPRVHPVDAARRTLSRYGISENRYTFVLGDVFES